MKDYSYIFNATPSFIDTMYAQYLSDPNSVEPGWRTFFEGFEFSGKSISAPTKSSDINIPDFDKEFSVVSIINGYRRRGHLLSDTNPIAQRKNRFPRLDLKDFGLSDADLDRQFISGKEIGLPNATLKEILQKLNKIYCGSIGFEYKHIENYEKRQWLRERIENRPLDNYAYSAEKKKRILSKLNGATVFEKFLHTKYIGQKRFSLEGGETTIPALDAIINKAADADVEEFVIGMAHRGRLNVLANVLGKTYENVFNEFEGIAIPDLSYGSGDVKYHLGFSSQVETASGKKVHLKLAPNPSHLEAVDPVVLGFSRAKADILYESQFNRILPILIHGDAALAGQGVCYETTQMSLLKGYLTGGTLHFVINNQVGFTTDFDDARSSTYSTGLAQVVQAPVFHVNGDEPEAVVFVSELAVEYRQKFGCDVFIDMVCYRRHGHNEGDDPQFTQPIMYKRIAEHPTPREIYVSQLTQRGDIDLQIAKEMEDTFWAELQARLDMVKQKNLPYSYQEPEQAWRSLRKEVLPKYFEKSPATGVSSTILKSIADHLMRIPEGFTPLTKIHRLLKAKEEGIAKNEYDWAMGELMAYGSILLENRDVRLSGEDVKRGTFSHRHAVFYDAETNKEYSRLAHLADQQGEFRIYNSLLSEFAVLGFEYGYALASPNNLVIWEAQFGDFVNGAQTIIDQFITTGMTKWHRMNGLVMLLPHGYEGQGPEHSSARLERWLQNASELNMAITNITTPANFFHALRRQLAWDFRIPLVVMSPKSLLRHPECVSRLEDFSENTSFLEVIDDKSIANTARVTKVLLCSGKIYYDLIKYRRDNKLENTAIVRIEQLYPFPASQLDEILKKYKTAKIVWVQEEPVNMGAATFVQQMLGKSLSEMVARAHVASPASGFKRVHDTEQAELLKDAFA